MKWKVAYSESSPPPPAPQPQLSIIGFWNDVLFQDLFVNVTADIQRS